MQTVVEVNSVEKSYGQAQVIRQCSFQLYKGKTYGLLGVNGAGKTTLMKMILGLQKYSGKIILRDTDRYLFFDVLVVETISLC